MFSTCFTIQAAPEGRNRSRTMSVVHVRPKDALLARRDTKGQNAAPPQGQLLALVECRKPSLAVMHSLWRVDAFGCDKTTPLHCRYDPRPRLACSAPPHDSLEFVGDPSSVCTWWIDSLVKQWWSEKLLEAAGHARQGRECRGRQCHSKQLSQICDTAGCRFASSSRLIFTERVTIGRQWTGTSRAAKGSRGRRRGATK